MTEIASTTDLDHSSSNSSSNTSNNPSSNNADGDENQVETTPPYSYKTRNNRGWSPDTIEEKKLGWAPEDIDALKSHLKEEGFSKEVLFATGLFNVTDDGKLLPTVQGRYIFPYYNADGEPAYIISRSIGTDRDGADSDIMGKSKYVKLKNHFFAEPIYGTDTIKEGEPLVITEGIADAITAHQHGIPCISPVTKQFKSEHHSRLLEHIIENDVPQVFIIQDADPPSTTVPERFKAEYKAEYDDDADDIGREPIELDSLAETDAITIAQKGPGFEGAMRTAQYLDEEAKRHQIKNTSEADASTINVLSKWSLPEQEAVSPEDFTADTHDDNGNPLSSRADEFHPTPNRAFETYLIELPRFGGIKYDLDDYLSDGMSELVPPAVWVSEILNFDTPTPTWITRLNTLDELQFTKPEQYKDTALHGDNSIKSIQASTLNYLPTIGPNNDMLTPNVSKQSSPTLPSNAQGADADLPSNSQGTSTNSDMWDVTFRDVLGIDVGYRGKSPFGHYGASENYFCVLSEDKAHCHKREVTYTPSTGVLVLEGERQASNPEGSLDSWEKFVYWRYLREKGIIDDPLPTEAMVAYAKKHGIASSGNGVTTKDGEYGEFETLTKDTMYQTFDHIEANHDVEIRFDPFGDRDKISDTNTPTTDNEPEHESAESADLDGGVASEQRSSDSESAPESSITTTESPSTDEEQSKQTNDDESYESSSNNGSDSDSDIVVGSSSQDSSTNTTGDTDSDPSPITTTEEPTSPDDDTEDEVAPIEDTSKEADLNPDNGGVASDEVDLDFGEGNSGSSSTDQDAATSSEEAESDNPHDRFKTYEEPSEKGDDFDPDREAVRQFVDEFAVVDPDRTEDLKTHKDRMFSAFRSWREINELELDDIRNELYEDKQKGNLCNYLEEMFDVDDGRYTIDGKRTTGYKGISLSEIGEELLEI